MTRAKDIPVDSFNPVLLGWLVKAISREVRLQATTAEQRRTLGGMQIRLRSLIRAMQRENHPLANQVLALLVKFDPETGVLVIRRRDFGVEEFLEEDSAVRSPVALLESELADPLADLVEIESTR